MPAVTASAPGKTILLGEHAVVYGRPAIAVPVEKVRAKASVFPDIRGHSGAIHIQAPDIALDTDLASLPEDHPFALAIQGIQQRLGVARLPAFTLKITSTIPVAAGLGSSAAVSVAILRAVSGFLGAALSPEEICQLAFRVEQRVHGNPSGIDNTVVTYARPILFRREHPLEVLHISAPFTLVIGDTGVQSSTAETVSAVRKQWQADQSRFEAIFDQIAGLVDRACIDLRHGYIGPLGPLMQENHSLLQEMGVSSPQLDQLVSAALQAGAAGAKLSGGGRGGNMIALSTDVPAEEIAAALQSAGAVRTLITTVPATI